VVSDGTYFGYYDLQVAASMQKEADFIPSYPNLPSKLICMLHNVALHVGGLSSCDMAVLQICNNDNFLRYLKIIIRRLDVFHLYEDSFSLKEHVLIKQLFSHFWILASHREFRIN